MAITYPLSTPTSIGYAEITLSALDAVAVSESPFSYKQQVFQHPGQRWSASVSIPPVGRQLAEPWVAFLLALNGRAGTFLLGDPLCTSPQGEGGGTVTVNGADQTGATLDITGATVSQTDWLKAGDYIQLGAGSTSRLHKVLQDVDTDGSGNATLDIWPDLRESPANGLLVTLTDCKGVFRLSSNDRSWNINNTNSYGISFEAVEVLT